jgi:hypothetical protein
MAFPATLDGLRGRLAVIGSFGLPSQGFKRQATHQPHQLLAHRFKLLHQRLGFFEPTLSRVIFKIRRHVTGNCGERE